MPVSSNLYAEKVFSEHPLGLWPIEEKSDYVNFVTEKASDLTDTDTWSVSQGSVVEDFLINRPFGDKPAFNLLNDNSFEVSISSESITENYFNPILKTFSVGMYVFAETENVQSFELDIFSNNDPNSFYLNQKTDQESFDIKSYGRWHFYQKTFDLFEEDFVELEEILVPVGLPVNIVKNNHGFSEGDPIILTSTGRLPGGILENTVYFVRVINQNSFSISLSKDGDLVVANSFGSGAHSAIPVKSVGLGIKFFLTDNNPASILMNGLSIGQESEEFQEKSLGVVPEKVSGIAIDETFSGIKTFDYGLSNNPGYLLVKNNQILAKNKNMPLVFGSDSLTSAYPHPYGEPSVIFPSLGFLSETGKYRTYTAEFWLRLNANLDYAFKIFGPVASQDGLYVDGPFLVLKIGRFVASHYVGDLYRPMLINIVYFPGGASLVINGEKVFDLALDISEINFPKSKNNEGKDQDWLGFYSNKEILSFEIDCFAIYPYRVATSLSKRRYVYGQAVEFPENITTLYNGKSFFADYPFSDFGTNYSYPDIGRWQRGILDNVLVDKNTLTLPKYSLPSFVFSNRSQSDWIRDLRENDRESINLKPSPSWQNTEGYMFFDKVNLAQDSMRCVYGVFEAKITQQNEEVLFRLDNEVADEHLDAVLEKITDSISEVEESDGLIFVKNNHQMKDGDLVVFEESEASLPINIVLGQEYRVNYIDKNSFSLSPSLIGPQVSVSKIIDSVAIDAPGTIFLERHNLSDNDVVSFSSTGSLPQGISANTEYYVKVLSKNRFMISENLIVEPSSPSDFVTISSNGLGIHSVKRVFSGPAVISKFAVSYYFEQRGQRSLVNRSPGISLGHLFVAGIDFENFSRFFGGNVSGFLKNIRQAKVYAGGSKNFEKTFSGKIHRFGFSNKKNFSKLGFLFDITGIPFLRYQFDGNGVTLPEGFSTVSGGKAYQKFVEDVLSHIASYTLFVKNEIGSSELEIACSASWQDYVPASYFSKRVLGRDGKRRSGLSFFQFNLDYPTPELFRDSCCDTTRSEVKAYISFQFIKEGANKRGQDFSQTLPAPRNNVIVPASNWQTTRYEVVNNSTVYFPKGVPLEELAIVIDLEIEDTGIILRPIRIKNLSISARSLDAISPNPIKSRFGSKAYPDVRYGFYADHDDFNPFSIYRDSTPYLYLTKYSGLKMSGDFDENINRGISFPLNEEKKTLFSLSALQFSMRFENPELLDEDLRLFEISSGRDYYSIFAKSIHPENERLFLYATDRSGEVVEDVGFYLNGAFSSKPTISLREWNMIGIAFANPIRMNSISGFFRIVGPVTFNNFSHYALSAVQEAQGIIASSRYKYFFEDEYFGISPSQIYAIYTGTNKLTMYDNVLLKPNRYQYTVFVDNSLRSETLKAV